MSSNHSTHIRFEYSDIVTSSNKIPYFGSENLQVSHPIFRGINYKDGSRLGECTDMQVIVIEHDHQRQTVIKYQPSPADTGILSCNYQPAWEACFQNTGWGSLDSTGENIKCELTGVYNPQGLETRALRPVRGTKNSPRS